MDQNRSIYYTLDLEHDYAGPAPFEAHEAMANPALLAKLEEVIVSNQLRLTVFATGRILDRHPEHVEFFQKLGAEIELHGYDHTWVNPNLTQEVEKGVEAYRAFFGKLPLGYRSQGGFLTPELIHALVVAGIQYDSSLIPSFRLGIYSNLRAQIGPHFYDHLPLLELPIAVIPQVRLLVAASYIRLLGFRTYQLLFRLFGRPSPLVFLFHLVDLVPVSMRKHLSPFLRTAYAIRESQGLFYFEKTVQYFQSYGYRPEFMSTLYREYTQKRSAPIMGDTLPISEPGK
jgi:peptidoglycan/xylan/chitin deacetylase (PgdA/CDA1 family)